MTQIVFDIDALDRFVERIGGSSPIPVLVGIFPVTSYRLALRLHNEVPGIVVPQDLQDALRDAGRRMRRASGSRTRASWSAGARELAAVSTSSRRTGGRSACSSCSAERYGSGSAVPTSSPGS